MGRKTLLTPELADELVVLLAGGMSASAAARAVGISRRSLTNWMPELRPRIARARSGATDSSALAEAALTLAIARSGDWHASAWLLERNWPERYGEKPPRDFPVRPADEEWP